MIDASGAREKNRSKEPAGAATRMIGARGSAHTAGAHGQDELWLLLVFMAIWYGSMLWFSSGPAAHRSAVDLTFNSMLDHLLHGRFDVDPRIVGAEGYLCNGRVYAYWGVWCALLRLPLWIFHRMDVDMTTWSCLAAVCVAATAKLRTVLLFERHAPQGPAAKWATDLMRVYILIGGSEIAYLRSNIYQEIVLWGAAFGAIFVYFAVKGLISRQFESSTLGWMALCAGLALLTRVSFGIGLILALSLLIVVLLHQSITATPGRRPMIQRWKHAVLDCHIVLPLGILAVSIALAGAVNYFRFGHPATFVDFNIYIGNKYWPDRPLREAAYGLFNLRRIPFGLLYYFFPVWALQTSSGHFLFEQTQTRWFDMVELPASSFLLTDLLPFCFIALLASALWRRRARSLPSLSQCAAIAIGLLAPCILMLTAIAMAYRYRMEFYPEIDFLAFLGLGLTLTDEKTQAQFVRCRLWMTAALVVSMVGSLVMWWNYIRAPFGPA